MKYTVFLNPEGTSRLPEDVSQLRKVELEANPNDSIWELAKTAEALSGISVQHARLLFPSVPSAEGARALSAVPYAVVKSDGAITWLDYPQHFENVAIADMERTKEDGLFDGDPHATILDLPDIGNGGLVHTWPEFLQWLMAIGGVYGGMKALLAPFNALARRIKRHREARADLSSEAAWLAEFIRRHHHKWEERGAKGPVDFLAVVLKPRQWEAARLRRLLMIDPQEAAKFLEVSGYEYNPQTKLHELTRRAKQQHLRGRLLEEFMGYDPATWQEDLGQP